MSTAPSEKPSAMVAAPVAFEVVDVLRGLCTLTRRSPTLDGSVPLRVAQACVPLLAGNAFGYQVVLSRRLELRRQRLGWSVAMEGGDELSRLHRGSLPMARASGLLDPASAWSAMLDDGIVLRVGPFGRLPLREAALRRAPLALFTGLFVRPRPGVQIRQSGTKNRRSHAYAIREAILDDAGAWTPVVLELDPHAEGFTLTGEVATLAALPAATAIRTLALDDAPEVAARHLRFYDQRYFATKRRGEVSRKYRREAAAPVFTERARAELDLVEAGPASIEASRPPRAHRGKGPVAWDGAPDRLVFRNAVGLRCRFDGLELRVEPDRDALARFSAALQARWAPVLERAAETAHPGALLYLSRYVTPHPPGEPHFFVKPAALLRTPPGTSLLIEGSSGDGYEVLRGVTESDRFHAAPAVFQLTPGAGEVAVPAGAPLSELFAVPRDLEAARFTLRHADAATAFAREA